MFSAAVDEVRCGEVVNWVGVLCSGAAIAIAAAAAAMVAIYERV